MENQLNCQLQSSTKNTPGPMMVLTMSSRQHSGNNLSLRSNNEEKQGTLSNSFYNANIAVILKPNNITGQSHLISKCKTVNRILAS